MAPMSWLEYKDKAFGITGASSKTRNKTVEKNMHSLVDGLKYAASLDGLGRRSTTGRLLGSWPLLCS